MKNALLFLLVCLLPVGLFAQQGDNNRQKALVFTHVTVIDATGAPAKPDMTVVVRGDRIEALGKTSKLTVPRNAQVVDATGKFLIPGLWDMHVHPILARSYLALFTANGVTGVRVLWGEPWHHKVRKEISAGQLIGPRMIIASPIIDGPNPIWGGGIVVSSEEEGRQAVRKVKKEGADFVKVYNRIPRDAYFAIADEAKKQGIPFAGHVPRSVSAAEASDAGQQSIEHSGMVWRACSTSGEEELIRKFDEAWRIGGPAAATKVLADATYSEQKAAELFARFVKNGTWVCPTLTVFQGMPFRDEEDLANDPRLKYMPPSTRDTWNNHFRFALATGEGRADLKKLCQKRLDMVGAMGRAGVGLLAGTDVFNPYCFPGFGLHDELALLVQAGLSPMEALRTATYNPAKFFGKLDSMGTIEQGKIADLVLLEANPLQDISNTQKIAAVVVGGKIFQRAALQKMLAQVKASRLHHVAARGKIEQVKSLIAEGADVNARDQQGWTPLHYACRKNRKETVEFLLAEGADVNARDAQGWTPALAALYAWELAVTDLLVEKGADTAAPHLAAYTGDLRGIKRLLEKDTPVDSLKGLTLLHAAAAGGHTDVVEFLIGKGFEATATTEDDKTTLYYAALGNHQEAAEILMANGAPVDSGKATPLFAAAYAGHKDMIEFLISKGADVNAVDNTRVTALHIAGEHGHVNVAALLIGKGADVNAEDKWLWTPLHYACWKNRKETVEFLLAKGADLNAKDEKGKTPLAVAKQRGHTEIVELLRKHEAKE